MKCQYIISSSNDFFIYLNEFIKGSLIFKFFINDIYSLIVFENQFLIYKENLELIKINFYLSDLFSEEKCECDSEYLVGDEKDYKKLLSEFEHTV